MKELIRNTLQAVLPKKWLRALFSTYHLALAYVGAVMYNFPSRELIVIGVTGTKGKSTTVELIRAILTEAGYITASAGTINFCIGDECHPNTHKMTMVGRFFLQKFLREAVEKGATHAVIEMSSEGALQHRHRFIDMDALVFTNLAPEHLERHGGMEAYAQAKLSIARALSQSPKRPRIIVANADDPRGKDFLAVDADIKAPFSLYDAEPYTADDRGVRFFWRKTLVSMPLPGAFNLKNALAAMVLCEALNVPQGVIVRAIEKPRVIPGRAQRVECGQDFSVIVDYAHTPDSLKALYETFGGSKEKADDSRKIGRRICVLGSAGGGRDTWKRPLMGAVADELCDIAILTDEDPYDEDPQKIVKGVEKGFKRLAPHVIMDRREAIRAALAQAQTGDFVLISGKGTDPYIMQAHGEKLPWSDKEVAREELERLLALHKK